MGTINLAEGKDKKRGEGRDSSSIERTAPELREVEERAIQRWKLDQQLIQATLRLINKKITNTDHQLLFLNLTTWKNFLLENSQFKIETIQDKSKVASSLNLYDLMIDLLQLKAFSFPDGVISKEQLAVLLNYAQGALLAPDSEDNLYTQKLLDFCNRLSAEPLDVDEVNCLRRIIKDFEHCKLLGTPNKITTALTRKLKETSILCQKNSLAQSNRTDKTSFQMKMSQYIEEEFHPYMRVMLPEIVEDIKKNKNIDPVIDFILNRHNCEMCAYDSIYAPTGKIRPAGVEQHLLDTLNTAKREYRSVRKCNDAVKKISSLQESLEKDLSTCIGGFWPQTIFQQILVLKTLKDQIQGKIEYPQIAAKNIKTSHEQLLSGTFFVKRTNQLLEEIATDYAFSSEVKSLT